MYKSHLSPTHSRPRTCSPSAWARGIWLLAYSICSARSRPAFCRNSQVTWKFGTRRRGLRRGSAKIPNTSRYDIILIITPIMITNHLKEKNKYYLSRGYQRNICFLYLLKIDKMFSPKIFLLIFELPIFE